MDPFKAGTPLGGFLAAPCAAFPLLRGTRPGARLFLSQHTSQAYGRELVTDRVRRNAKALTDG